MVRKVLSNLLGAVLGPSDSTAAAQPTQIGTQSASQQGGGSDTPSLGRCTHGVNTQCPACAEAGEKKRGIRKRPRRTELEPAKHVGMLIKALQAAGHVGLVPHEDLVDVHNELCKKHRIEPLIPRELLRAVRKQLARRRPRICDPNDDRQTGVCYEVPRPTSTEPTDSVGWRNARIASVIHQRWQTIPDAHWVQRVSVVCSSE